MKDILNMDYHKLEENAEVAGERKKVREKGTIRGSWGIFGWFRTIRVFSLK